MTYVITGTGVSAQSFMQAFTLAQTAFNVQLASPRVVYYVTVLIHSYIHTYSFNKNLSYGKFRKVRVDTVFTMVD